MPIIPQGPKRIVCLTEEPTEILYRLGCEDRIVGISAYTVRPKRAKAEKPIVSAFIDGSVRKIVNLQPDLVIGFSDIQANLAQKLISAHQNVLIFNQRSVKEILEVISQIGSLVQRPAAAKELVQKCLDNLHRVEKIAAKKSYRPRVYFEEWDEPMITAIEWVSELIHFAGGDDIFRESSTGKGASERYVDVEKVVAADPEVVLASWCGRPFDQEKFKARFVNKDIDAIRNHRIYEIPAEIILQPGPAALLDGVTALQSKIHRTH